MPQNRCSTRSGRPTRWRRACSTSTSTSCTRSPRRRPSSRCAWPGAPCAAPTARWRPPTTTCPPTARPPPRRSATSSRACRSRRSSATAREFGVPIYSIGSARQGIVHVIGPELGVTQPGMTIVCGDSHTSTHGAFGALAFGIGTSEVEHVLATQTLQQRKPKSMRIRYEGELGYGVTAKDLILGTIGRIGVAGGVGHVIEYAGPAIEALSMEGRMTVCNMTIEGGGRAGHDRPGRHHLRVGRRPRGRARPAAARRVARAAHRRRRGVRHRGRRSTPGELSPQVTWGTTPGMVTDVTAAVPEPRDEGEQRALEYMALDAGTPIQEIRARPRVHRLVHELAHRRPARGRRGGARPPRGRRPSTRWWCPAPSR